VWIESIERRKEWRASQESQEEWLLLKKHSSVGLPPSSEREREKQLSYCLFFSFLFFAHAYTRSHKRVEFAVQGSRHERRIENVCRCTSSCSFHKIFIEMFRLWIEFRWWLVVLFSARSHKRERKHIFIPLWTPHSRVKRKEKNTPGRLVRMGIVEQHKGSGKESIGFIWSSNPFIVN
jgi:hypothetical protein